MVKPDKIRVKEDTLPDVFHSEMHGFVGLKQCIEALERPMDSEKSLIGKIPKLFGKLKSKNLSQKLANWLPIFSKNEENTGECITDVGPSGSEIGQSSGEINCIDIRKLIQNEQINRILQKHLTPSKLVNDLNGWLSDYLFIKNAIFICLLFKISRRDALCQRLSDSQHAGHNSAHLRRRHRSSDPDQEN